MQADPTAVERSAVDEVLGPPDGAWDGAVERTALDHRVARGGHRARDDRHLLLPALHALQGAAGWISRGGLNYVCERLSVPPAEAYGVATFYAMFSVEERPPTVVHGCDDLACRLADADHGLERLASKDVTVVPSPCLGLCERAPALLIQRAGDQGDSSVAPVTADTLEDFMRDGVWAATDAGIESAPQAADGRAARNQLRLLRRLGIADPTSIDDYRAHGGYEALRLALEHGPEWTLREVTDAKLLGRGGAAFPTGVKWKAVAEQPAHPHYFVCNADESEPGTFKDRVVMEQDPFAVVEALTIAGLTTGCEQAYIYIRGEYPLATERLTNAIEEARRHGFLGDDVMGHGAPFDVEIRRGAGAYICGEETALFNSLEGKRGEPRNKPPFPVQRGLFGKPTGINNVETLINVLEVVREGAQAYAEIGTPGSTGPRLFCLSGDVERPGVYEHEHGVTLREVIDAAGGVRGGRPLKAVLLGGAAGGFVGPDKLDVRLTFEDARAGGYTLGSGVVMLFDEGADLTDACLRIARFFRDESCGQCVPCRVGTVRQEEALHRLVQGRTLGSRADEFALLDDVAQVMRDASICGLGQTAASAVQSAIASLGVFGGDAI
ncbi:MAG: NAD(P)H-dependent oxidoreductase subunit E [Actinomycetota bacterium]|nr:NAD(P)H-dependent oxidoreductase subunit E [Actinomycetota bacterium]MDH5224445.1 NAD(P)H-dependent oxidoreductase subunit E [Actinomycetota bacterium]MDH5312576.1 NAD(P)H-dependent oxidoreductase subunit E [Actinomycetota bacterium]